MPPARKILSFSAEGEAEAKRLRSLLAGAPAAPRDAIAREAVARDAVAREAAREDGTAVPVVPEGDAPLPDWSATLDNINGMAALLRDQAERLAAAEARAREAELRAEAAETWLRRLHRAVLDGLPAGRAA